MELKYTDAYKTAEEITNLNWKILTKNTILWLIIFLIIGIILFIYGIVTFKKYSHNESYYSESNIQILSINNYSTWHFSFSLGALIIFWVILLIKAHFNLKKKFFKNAKEKASRMSETDDDTVIIQLDNELVKYKSTELNMEMKWILFTDYIAKENYIFLNIEKKFRIPIDKRLVSTEDMNWLLKTIETNNIKEIK
jgi:cytochrome b subunit of formate dehydrogenase